MAGVIRDLEVGETLRGTAAANSEDGPARHRTSCTVRLLTTF
jgi:hypothetical protein